MWLLLVFIGIAVGIGSASQLPKDFGPWILAVASAPILVGIIIAAVLQHRIDKNRRAGLCQVLRDLGMEAHLHPPNEAKSAFFGTLQHLERNASLQSGAANLQWIAFGHLGGRRAMAFEHEYLTGSGKYTQEHVSTCIAWEGSHGWLTLVKPRIGEGRALRRVAEEVSIADAKFDRDWIIWGEQAVAIQVLKPDVRQLLSDSPRGEIWCIGGGWSCCIYRNAMDPANLLKFVERAGRIAFPP
jgi:hypothetical protein